MSVVMGNHLGDFDVPGGPAPAARASLVAIVAYYLYTTVQVFSMPVIKETSQCAPAPNGGRTGAGGLSSR